MVGEERKPDPFVFDERLRQFYSDLKREYDLILDRRKNLNSQATSLMSFAGIIETVLVGFLIALATNNDARDFVTGNSNFLLLATFIGIGFFCYVATAFFAVLAFWETRWARTPQLDPDPKRIIEKYFEKSDNIKFRFFARQIVDANSKHMETNRMKFNLLNIASIFLVIGIGFTGAGGFTMLFMVLPN